MRLLNLAYAVLLVFAGDSLIDPCHVDEVLTSIQLLKFYHHSIGGVDISLTSLSTRLVQKSLYFTC